MLEISISECTSGQLDTPFSLVQVTLTKQKDVDLKWQVSHYRDLWVCARDRKQELVATNARMKKEYKTVFDYLNEKIKEFD